MSKIMSSRLMHILGHVNFCLATVAILVIVAFVAGCTAAQVMSLLCE